MLTKHFAIALLKHLIKCDMGKIGYNTESTIKTKNILKSKNIKKHASTTVSK